MFETAGVLMAVSGRQISWGKLMTGFGDETRMGIKNFAFAGKENVNFEEIFPSNIQTIHDVHTNIVATVDRFLPETQKWPELHFQHEIFPRFNSRF